MTAGKKLCPRCGSDLHTPAKRVPKGLRRCLACDYPLLAKDLLESIRSRQSEVVAVFKWSSHDPNVLPKAIPLSTALKHIVQYEDLVSAFYHRPHMTIIHTLDDHFNFCFEDAQDSEKFMEKMFGVRQGNVRLSLEQSKKYWLASSKKKAERLEPRKKALKQRLEDLDAENRTAIERLEAIKQERKIVEAAIEFIDLGVFGSCQSCSEKISKERLDAHLAVVLCEACDEDEKARESRKPSRKAAKIYTFPSPWNL